MPTPARSYVEFAKALIRARVFVVNMFEHFPPTLDRACVVLIDLLQGWRGATREGSAARTSTSASNSAR
eukprot:4966455-Lingulodinium_polyedra.AAC.1